MKTTLLSILIGLGLGANAQYVDNDKDATAFTLEETKNLQSLPGAPHVLYLNVAGYYVWKNSPENVAQVVRLWRQVAEDYRPFNINVSTKKADYDAVGAQNALYMNLNIHYAGGSCPLGIYGRGESIGGQNCHSAAQFYAITHETGHGMGIHHHTSYENIIGDGWKYVNSHVTTNQNGAYFSHWLKGQSEGGYYTDDVALIASKVGFRDDEHGNNNATASDLNISAEEVDKRENNGVIEQDGDVDMFKFQTNGGEVDLKVNPLKFYHNLHVKADVVDEEGNVVIEGSPYFHFMNSEWPYVPGDLSEEQTQVKQASHITGDLTPGTYYLRVTNSGYIDNWGDGYTSYSSLGYYEVEGTVKSDPVSVEEVSSDYMIYPNPITVGFNIEGYENLQNLEMFDLSGRLIKQFETQQYIDVSSMAKGDYILKLHINSGDIVTKRITIK